MAGITWTVPINNLREGGAIARRAAERALSLEAANVLARSRSYTRVKTAALQGSERVEVSNGELILSAGGGSVDYAWYQHDGTYKMTGTHFIERALTELAPVVFDRISGEIANEFRP